MKRILTLALALFPTAALAHPGHGSGFDAGLLHPLAGADHLLAMTGVGLWAALQQGASRWALPLSFLTAMACGFVLANLGLTLPATEPMILASVFLLGAAITLTLRVPLAATLPLIALFGLAHGAAHGSEGSGPTFALGMLAATAVLHSLGVGVGLTLNRFSLRLAGGATLFAGLGLAFAG
ncbi:MAG: HupE/UreJ family protein [bacterium]